MVTINVNDAKAHLSKYLKAVEQGETIVLCRHNKPIAELRPLQAAKPRRVFGIDEGQGYTVPPEFFEPLDAEMTAYFNGEKED